MLRYPNERLEGRVSEKMTAELGCRCNGPDAAVDDHLMNWPLSFSSSY
jgi:hypothetical protein